MHVHCMKSGDDGKWETYKWPHKDAALKLKNACFLEESYDESRHHFVNEGPNSQSYGFPSSHGLGVYGNKLT